MPYVVPLSEYSVAVKPVLGGKNASLGEMMSAGLPVPPGFAVTTEGFEMLMADGELARRLQGLLALVDPRKPAEVENVSRKIRHLIDRSEVPPAVASAVTDAYHELCSTARDVGLPVAVRSSATAEDLPDASFAGEHDTFLWVTGAAGVLRHMVRCWSSLYTARAICYRMQAGFAHDAVAMSVGIQKMVRPTAAGVAFTLNPSNGDRSQVAIDAAWGLGEAVVSGEVTPDNFLVDKVIGEITQRRISNKTVEHRVVGDAVKRVELTGPRATSPCVTDDEIKAIARLARRTERHYGCPQDIEWAVDADRSFPDSIVLLQARPETVWSRKAQPCAAGRTAIGLQGIVDTLCSPIHSRTKVHS